MEDILGLDINGNPIYDDEESPGQDMDDITLDVDKVNEEYIREHCPELFNDIDLWLV